MPRCTHLVRQVQSGLQHGPPGFANSVLPAVHVSGVYVPSESSQATHHFQGFLPAVARTVFWVLSLPCPLRLHRLRTLEVFPSPADTLLLKAELTARLAGMRAHLILGL